MPDRRLKVLVVGPTPPPMGGIVRYAQDLMTSDLARRHDLELFYDNVPFGWRPAAAKDPFTWNVLRRDGVLATAKVLRFVGSRMVAMRRTLRRERHDVVHLLSTAGLGFFRNGVHVRIARRNGARVVFHHLGQIDDLWARCGPRRRALMRRLLDAADVHVVQSDVLAERVREMTRKPVRVVYNGVDVAALAPREGYSRSDGARFEVLTLGILGHRKGTFDLIDAARMLQEKIPGLRVTFVGSGDVQGFRRLAAEKGVTCARFLGGVDDAERIRLLHASDLFALPSHAEGQPIALLEAMAAGLPVVSTPIGAIPEVVRAENGFLVKPGDVEALAVAIDRFAGDAAMRERVARRNARDAAERFDLRRVIDQIGEIYEEAAEAS